MNSQIIAQGSVPKRPTAIAKEKDGIVLYWVEELGVAGLSFRGLERLLDCDHRTAANLLQGGEVNLNFEAETVTDGGIQVVKLISESDLAVVLTTVVGSRCKPETRKNAAAALAKLASAGFKLLVMMELAPQQLAAQAVQYASDADKLIRLEELRLRSQEINASMLTMHGAAWLALQGVGVAERETVVTEIVEPETKRSTRILSADQLKKAIRGRTGQKLQTMKQFTDALRAEGRDDLLIPVTRHQTSEYVEPDKLDEAIAVVYGKQRQKLIGE